MEQTEQRTARKHQGGPAIDPSDPLHLSQAIGIVDTGLIQLEEVCEAGFELPEVLLDDAFRAGPGHLVQLGLGALALVPEQRVLEYVQELPGLTTLPHPSQARDARAKLARVDPFALVILAPCVGSRAAIVLVGNLQPLVVALRPTHGAVQFGEPARLRGMRRPHHRSSTEPQVMPPPTASSITR